MDEMTEERLGNAVNLLKQAIGAARRALTELEAAENVFHSRPEKERVKKRILEELYQRGMTRRSELVRILGKEVDRVALQDLLMELLEEREIRVIRKSTGGRPVRFVDIWRTDKINPAPGSSLPDEDEE